MIVKTAGIEEYSKHLRMLVAGQPTVEKMRFAATAPNCLWASVNADRTQLAKQGSRYIEVKGLHEILDIKNVLECGAEAREELFGFQIDTLIIDSVDELQRVILDEHLASEGRLDTKIEDWGWLSKRFHDMFAALGKLDLDIVYLIGTKDVFITESETWFKPALQGSFVDQIHRYMDYSFLLAADTAEPKDEGAISYEEGEIVFSARQPEQIVSLFTKPVLSAQWIKDSTGGLPFRITLNFQDDYLSIVNARANVDLTESQTSEIDPNAVVETEPDPAQPQESDQSESTTEGPSCVECGAAVEPNFVALCEMKEWPVLCKKDFVARNSK